MVKRFCLTLLLLGVLISGFAGLAVCTVSAEQATQAVVESYGTDTVLQQGMLVRLKDGDASKVVVLSEKDAMKLHGVVVPMTDAAVALSQNTSVPRSVYVATFGRYNVLVSNQNGAIKVGDYVTISALDGIGMKTDTGQPIVVGKAAADFSGTNNIAGTATLKLKDGSVKQVSIGRIPVDINVSHNPLQESSKSSDVPGILAQATSAIANKPVSAARIYLSLMVLLVTTVIAGSILYSGVHTGLASIGRNPLARKSIMRGLLQVALTSLIILVLGLSGVYLLLTL